ncbi:MAG: DEAD/DEAH box helicase [Clostridia bacterium]|nr:DEAD/DEAH box helicase [Clostridia bacterium]
MIESIGNIDDLKKKEIAESIVETFNEKYPDIEGEAYYGYPIYIDEITESKICVDLAIVSKIGVYIFNILTEAVTDYTEMQDSIYVKVENKFRKQPFLMHKRKLIFDITIITYSKEILQREDENYIAFSNEDVIDIIEKNKDDLYDDQKYKNILSGLQEAYGINPRKEREGVTEGTKAYLINKMNDLVEKYDTKQMEAILSDTKGIQRIRGMAGSGKTIVLARKAVELHMAHRDWIIVVTYSTRALKHQLVNLISKFYAAKNEGAKYDPKKIKIMQAWGAATSPGVYYEICISHGVNPLNFSQAKLKFNKNVVFSKACYEAIQEIKDFHKMYDCILIDEAQDFDKNFMNLCLNVLGPDKRLVYAYDELQKLNEETMPAPKEIFGQDISNDTPLTVCYRNQSKTIVTAHAIGMGLYRKNEGLIQIPSSIDVWQTIGYKTDKDIVEGGMVELYRTKETSPELLNYDKDDIIDFYKYNNSNEVSEALLRMIKENMENDQLLPSDIMIIDMDTIGTSENKNKLDYYLYNNAEYRKLSIHLAGTISPEDFFRKDSIVYSTIFRAKGNEAFMVYIINAQRSAESLTPRSDRNALFTAITRSKGWVRVLGYGDEMQLLCDEFSEIKKNNFKLYFEHYPTKEEQKQLILNNKDLDKSSMSSLNNTRALIMKLKADGKVTDVQLIKELFGISTKDEIMKMLEDEEDYDAF